MREKIWDWYSREKVQKALIEISKNREVVPVFSNSFGKRPDVLQFPGDIMQAVAEGAIAFHASLERWKNPMQLKAGMNKEELDELRIGWDILIDPDVNDFEIAKAVTKVIIEAFKDHGVKSYSVKYTGGKGFHLAIPFEALPEKINLKPSRILYPEVLQKLIEYLKWYVRESLREEILSLDNPINLSKRVGKSLEEIVGEEGIEPFKLINMDIFGLRHLFRLPYSLHEKTLLVSVPLKPERIDKFKKEDALPEKVKVEEKFLTKKSRIHDAEALIIEALDWAAKHKIEVKEVVEELRVVRKRVKKIPENFFPPCIKTILKGLPDGRKRSVFILINFLRNMGWSMEEISKKLEEWNEKNYPPLRANYLRTQLRWHARQERNLLPPNCNHENFYVSIGVCNPDEICKNKSIKNPINYPFKKLKLKKIRK
ncbi:MAG: hypothetical protein DRP00_02695 [Candidatus Aenigmatarchaeota archaeon]|nr:MAG: hypothetical protein DRP00_02695 [Candidatus Aenigmarchaeota archaeon]